MFLFEAGHGHIFPILLVIWACVVHTLTDTASCQTPSAGTCDQDQNSDSPSTVEQPRMALVLYDESRVLPFHKDERNFIFGDHKIVIRQNWRDVGIAAVVWDAVS